MNEDWGEGKARIFNPPVNMIALVLRKIEQEHGRGVLVVPTCPAQLWFARLRALSSDVTNLRPGDPGEPL